MHTGQTLSSCIGRRAERVLFTADSDGYASYRIPVLVATSRGTLLATCEARKAHGGDWHETHVLLRRSTDGGTTWDPPRMVNDLHPSDLRCSARGVEPRTEYTGGLVHGNAVLIPTPGDTVHLIYCVEYHRVFQRISRDDGVTWGPAREITAAFDGLRVRYPFKVCATGPGHGVRRADGTLVIPVWLSLGSGGHGHRPSVVCTLLGADDGAQWRVGGLVAVDGGHDRSGAPLSNPNESALAELPDGRILISMRTESGPKRRLHALSQDGGTTFGQPFFVEALYDAVCEASLLRVGGSLLFSAPDPRDDHGRCDGNPNTRRRLVLARSADGLAWRQLGVIEAGSAGYSHLATHGGRLWCLFEDKARDPAAGFDTGTLTCVELDTSASGT